MDAVSTGKINAGYAMAAYWQGKVPSAAFFSAIPFGPEAGEYLAWLWYGDGLKLWQELYYDDTGYNVKVLPCSLIAPETSGWFAKEIKSAKDLKGMRMRFFGLGGRTMQKLGVSVSQIPGGEIFAALEKGALDDWILAVVAAVKTDTVMNRAILSGLLKEQWIIQDVSPASEEYSNILVHIICKIANKR